MICGKSGEPDARGRVRSNTEPIYPYYQQSLSRDKSRDKLSGAESPFSNPYPSLSFSLLSTLA
ncbi:hypothetical protein GCM10007362_06620 [Saccharibacillus endophyticus]|uniref:Uncharacterized protein n=1 Tax=Saccharibacillus endophyticus TaxID=2060666 RepID=A0ABQ1ZLT0_9BACL|nr:hypothetical protein GCM10007362_06620 [Saccharibacillus endophyticus]